VDEHERLARIRLVTERFNELQGLRAALIGSAFAFAMMGCLIATGWRDNGIALFVALGLALVLIMLGEPWLDGYYAATFGRVAAPSAPEKWLVPAGVVVIVALTVFGPHHGGIFLFLGTRSLWIAIRDWPLSQHHFFSAAAAAIAAATQLTDVARQAPDSAFAAGFLLVGVVTTMTGFADHRLLAESVDRRARERGNTAGGEPESM
jgi:hypothetical protein